MKEKYLPQKCKCGGKVRINAYKDKSTKKVLVDGGTCINCLNEFILPTEEYHSFCQQNAAKILECSSRGDKRFSAMYAQVQVNNKTAPIEVHYQLSKRKKNSKPPKTIKDAKGMKPDYFVVGDQELPLNLLTAWYLLLWVKYLDKNPDLVKHAKQFDLFNDIYAKPGTNNQAWAIECYVKEGRDYIFSREDVKELVKRLKQRSKTAPKT